MRFLVHGPVSRTKAGATRNHCAEHIFFCYYYYYLTASPLKYGMCLFARLTFNSTYNTRVLFISIHERISPLRTASREKYTNNNKNRKMRGKNVIVDFCIAPRKLYNFVLFYLKDKKMKRWKDIKYETDGEATEKKDDYESNSRITKIIYYY